MSKRNIRIESIERQAVEDQEVEIVERKGIGHPDSICDGIAESVAGALAREYLSTESAKCSISTPTRRNSSPARQQHPPSAAAKSSTPSTC